MLTLAIGGLRNLKRPRGLDASAKEPSRGSQTKHWPCTLEVFQGYLICSVSWKHNPKVRGDLLARVEFHPLGYIVFGMRVHMGGQSARTEEAHFTMLAHMLRSGDWSKLLLIRNVNGSSFAGRNSFREVLKRKKGGLLR
jgi:hypothetical protein